MKALRVKLNISESETKKLIAYEEMIVEERADWTIINKVMDHYIVFSKAHS